MSLHHGRHEEATAMHPIGTKGETTQSESSTLNRFEHIRNGPAVCAGHRISQKHRSWVPIAYWGLLQVCMLGIFSAILRVLWRSGAAAAIH